MTRAENSREITAQEALALFGKEGRMSLFVIASPFDVHLNRPLVSSLAKATVENATPYAVDMEASLLYNGFENLPVGGDRTGEAKVKGVSTSYVYFGTGFCVFCCFNIHRDSIFPLCSSYRRQGVMQHQLRPLWVEQGLVWRCPARLPQCCQAFKQVCLLVFYAVFSLLQVVQNRVRHMRHVPYAQKFLLEHRVHDDF
jgi:hypothetical protein